MTPPSTEDPLVAPERAAPPRPVTVVVVSRVLGDYRTSVFLEGADENAYRLEFLAHQNRFFTKVKRATKLPSRRSMFRNLLPGFLERRGFFFNPRIAIHLFRHRPDLVILEGESNLLNNIFVVPALVAAGVPFGWWTLGVGGLGDDRQAEGPRAPVSWRRRLIRPLMLLVYHLASRLIVYGSRGKKSLLDDGAPESKISIAQNALAPSFARGSLDECRRRTVALVRDEHWEDRLRITYVGALVPQKCPLMLIESAALAQEATGVRIGIYFVGDGPLMAECRRLARLRGVEVHMAGYQQELAPAYMLAGEVVCLPGLGGLAINHAMMVGRPVICGPADGTEEDLVLDGRTGYYINPMTRENLAEALVGLIRDRSSLEEMGRAALAHVESVASVEAMIEGLLGWFLASRHGPRVPPSGTMGGSGVDQEPG